MMANKAVAVTGGRIRSAEHEIGLRHSWRLTVAPSSIEDVVLSVAPPESCDDSGALCATDGRKLSSGTEVRVKGPANIAADGEVAQVQRRARRLESVCARSRVQLAGDDLARSHVRACGSGYQRRGHERVPQR